MRDTRNRTDFDGCSMSIGRNESFSWANSDNQIGFGKNVPSISTAQMRNQRTLRHFSQLVALPEVTTGGKKATREPVTSCQARLTLKLTSYVCRRTSPQPICGPRRSADLIEPDAGSRNRIAVHTDGSVDPCERGHEPGIDRLELAIDGNAVVDGTEQIKRPCGD